jgi:hypothetical protein
LVVLGIYLIFTVQVIKWMPLSSAMAGGELSYRASKLIQNEIGFNRVNMSMMLAGGAWAFVAGTLLFKQWNIRILMLGCAAAVALGQALTGGRTGYGVWALLGVIFGVIRWRRALPIVPLLAVIVLTLLPGVSERLFQGFGGRQGVIETTSDEYEITSGRNVIWPYVIAEIKKAPVFGHGRLAMNRIGLDQFLPQEKRVATIAKLCEMGHADRMVLSHDASCYFDWAPDHLIPLVVPNWHFNYIPDAVIPDLKKAGVTAEQIRTMTVDNPRRIFEQQGGY